jgi:hypothetical protein
MTHRAMRHKPCNTLLRRQFPRLGESCSTRLLPNRGGPVSAKTLKVLWRGWGEAPSPEGRRRISEFHKRRGTWPPAAGRPWAPDELALLGTMSDADVARRIDRTVGAVRCMRTRRWIGTAVYRRKK